jgi:hypothetical protein
MYEQRIEVHLVDGNSLAVRQITLRLSSLTRHRDTELRLLTNLPTRVRAGRIREAYRQRWTIENYLGQLARALNAEIQSLRYPGFVLATAGGTSLARYRGHTRAPTKPRPRRRFNGSRHVSTQKIIEARK